jgi:glycosyltransferase involved in cell wall biosynthesis
MPFISVIIPTYNRKKLLCRAIDSVMRQTFHDFELIVVDDASEDGTHGLAYFSGENTVVQYIGLPLHRGVAAARNLGVSKSLGTWICFLDSDDEWHKDKLKKQVAWHEAHKELRISQTQEIWIRNSVRVNPPKTHAKIHGIQFKENLERCMITPSSVMMEKRLFLEMGGFNESLPACEDYDLWLRITSAYPVGLLDELLLTRYGGHDDQLSSMVPILDRFRIRGIVDIMNSGKLSQEQNDWAGRQLVKKAEILAGGHKKRGKKDEHEFYQRLARRYRKQGPSSALAAPFI